MYSEMMNYDYYFQKAVMHSLASQEQYSLLWFSDGREQQVCSILNSALLQAVFTWHSTHGYFYLLMLFAQILNIVFAENDKIWKWVNMKHCPESYLILITS